VGQLAKDLSGRKRGEFPSQTIPNPRGHEELKAVTILRSGKVTQSGLGVVKSLKTIREWHESHTIWLKTINLALLGR
jgi:hypothetical protein